MLLPDKHIRLAESVLGLGAFILEQLDHPKSLDSIHDLPLAATGTKALPAPHDIESVTLSVVILYSNGAIQHTSSGKIARCAS